jgi:NhaP-type Na+/H+ and K+/H+ antiporters with a unique C-terminal domain
MNTQEILILMAGIILLGFIGEYGFRKKRIPDMILLLFIGILIHYSGVLGSKTISSLEAFVGLFGTIALTLIVFGGVIEVDLNTISSAMKKGIVIALLDVIFTILVVTPILYYLIKIQLLISLLLAAILAETSATLVIPMVQRIIVREDIVNLVKIESIMNSVFNIITVLLILDVIQSNSTPLSLASTFFANISEGLVLGAVVGFAWVIVVKTADTPHLYMATVGILFFLWGISQYLNASPILAIFIFSIIIAGSTRIKYLLNRPGYIDLGKLVEFNQEIQFFILTFFYVYIGLLINILNFYSIILALIITGGIVAARFLEISLIDVTTKWFGPDRNLMYSFLIRGSTVIVLIGYIYSLDPPIFFQYSNTIFFTVLLSIAVGWLLYSYFSKKYEVAKS